MLHISSPSARAVLTCGQVFLINCISDDDTVHVRDLVNIWYIIKIWLAEVKKGMVSNIRLSWLSRLNHMGDQL